MYAIINTGGKQYRVAVGDIIDVELLEGADQGAEITFGEVLFAFDGSKVHLGKSAINFPVHAEVLDIVKGEKISTLKYKRSHNQCRKWGHRQKYQRVKITGIGQKGKGARHGT